MTILIKTVRVYGLRGLSNIEVNLEPVTVLTGMNNTGKTSFLKAIQIAFGNRNFLSEDDFHISKDVAVGEIIVDINIIAVDDTGKQLDLFSESWETVFTEKRIVIDTTGKATVPIRTIVNYDPFNGNFKAKQFVLKEWSTFEKESGEHWYQTDNGTKNIFNLDELFFVYTDAQRDLLEDLKVKNSSLGKMLSKITYNPSDVEKIEAAIDELNKTAVSASDVLSNIATTLKGLDSAMDNSSTGVEISPFAKRIRDLNKGVSIQYSNFSMEYHGMGTRSWSSLLTLKSFVELLKRNAIKEDKSFFPIITIEEPETHLHPNAQKKIYSQMASMPGQKIISTHSPYIAASAELNQIRSLCKNGDVVVSGNIDTSNLSSEDIRKINRQVINTRGEIFFAKAVVLFEGETEEQALSIFASKYFDTNLLELGINFVGVGGKTNYLPFIRLLTSLNIHWFIFSDCDRDTHQAVKNQLQKIQITSYENIVFQDYGNDFEKQIIADGYQDEIKLAILNCVLPENAEKRHIDAKKSEVAQYTDEFLYATMTGSKTEYGVLVPESIINSGKELPPLVTKLFSKVKTVL